MGFALLAAFLNIKAQNKTQEGITYFLPKTEVRCAVLVEKTVFTPGDYAGYADLFIKKKAKLNAQTSFRIVGVQFYSTAIPDSSKRHTVTIDRKHSVIRLELDKNGVLKAVNAKAPQTAEMKWFTPSAKRSAIDPRDYMNQETLSAGSSAKMAELVAQDIYDIRESKDMLARGEAEYMPKDGEQLKIMLNSLNIKERALLQLFEGTTVSDTTQHFFSFTPVKGQGKTVLFRFSKRLGITHKDDLAGAPCYVSVEDLNIIPTLKAANEGDKKQKEDIGLYVNLPGKIKVKLEGEPINTTTYETYAAQFGKEELVSGSLFNKKFTAHIVLDSITGYVESFKIEPLE